MAFKLKVICQSVKYRLSFIFLAMLLLVFSVVAVLVDNIFIDEKRTDLRSTLFSQSLLYETCINNDPLQNKQLFTRCYQLQSEVLQNNVFLFDTNKALLWNSKRGLRENDALDSLVASTIASPGQLVNYDSHINLLSILNNGRIIILSIAEQDFSQQITSQRFRLIMFLLFFVLVLSFSLFILLVKGFKPLKEMAHDLEVIAAGKGDQLDANYATEFNDMKTSLNNLLNAEKHQRERYRNTLADLAHSLKTPLAVLQGAANESLKHDDYMRLTQEQVRRMDQIIQHQLNRAVKSIGDGTKTSAVTVTPIIERILLVLSKVYRDKDVRPILNLGHKIELIADERDLMEVLGNMLENAFKYCRSEVAVSMYDDKENVYIVIEDDGSGVSESMRYTILERGERADTSATPGQGIGLSVAVDILSSYNCRLEVEDSFSLGGAKFSITFPKH
jgi:two-component system sensor histidine kinase PhoQ